MYNLEFALEMKNKRLASGLSQGELASLTHLSRYSINRFENGKANASRETQNIILRCLNYYVCDKPFYLLVDYLFVRFPTTDALAVIEDKCAALSMSQSEYIRQAVFYSKITPIIRVSAHSEEMLTAVYCSCSAAVRWLFSCK